MRRAAGSGNRVDMALLAACVVVALVLRVSNVEVRAGVAAFLRQTVLAPLFAVQATAESWKTALASFDAVVASRDSAVMRSLELQASQAESERLESILALGGRLGWGFLSTRVLHDARLERTTTLMIAAGVKDGVQLLSPVVTSDGLVGVVKTTDERTSIVGLWTDPDFAVGAMSADGQAFGIATPHLDGGSNSYLLELRNVHSRLALPPGTEIVAAGSPGSVYPAMVPIGTIIEELEGESGWARTYLLRPAVMPKDLSTVMVLNPARAAEGGNGVWMTSAQRDSLGRRVVAVGDSIARQRYSAEVKARADSALNALRNRGAPPDTGTQERAETRLGGGE